MNQDLQYLCGARRFCEISIQSAHIYVYYYRTYEKAVSGGGEREKGGHVLRDTTSRGLYVRVWPPHTSERRGGGGGCEQEGWQGGEGRAKMSHGGQEERQRHIRRCQLSVRGGKISTPCACTGTGHRKGHVIIALMVPLARG